VTIEARHYELIACKTVGDKRKLFSAAV